MQAVVSANSFNSYTSLLTIDSLLNGRFDVFIDALKHMVLPILTLSYINWATFLRVTRSSWEPLRRGTASAGTPRRTWSSP